MEPILKQPSSISSDSPDVLLSNKARHRNSFSSVDTKASTEFQELLDNSDWASTDPSSMVTSSFFTQNQPSYRDMPDFYPNFLSESKSTSHFHGWFINQPTNREILVTWLDQVCLKFRFSPRSISLAILILDRVSLKYNDQEYETRVMMLLCLSIATKMLEAPTKCLGLYSICEFFDFRYSMDCIIEMECCVFAAINHNACGNTTLDFLLYYLSQGVFSQLELDDLPDNHPSETRLRTHELQLLKMCFETLKLPSLNAFKPSIVAASLITILRSNIGLLSWIDSHRVLTNYSLLDLSECIALLSDVNVNIYQRGLDTSFDNTMCWQYMDSISGNLLDSMSESESDKQQLVSNSQDHDNMGFIGSLLDAFDDISSNDCRQSENKQNEVSKEGGVSDSHGDKLPSMKRVKY